MAELRSDVLVRMPPDLKRRLAAEVERRRASLNDVAVAILASRFGVPFEPSGRRGSPPRPAGDVLLRMPRDLKDRLARRAGERKKSTHDLIVETLSEGLGRRKESMSENGKHAANGKGREGKVRVAIIGVGNCANSLLQGVAVLQGRRPTTSSSRG